MTRICFIDTETTSLRHDRRAWEIGLIIREPTREHEERWFIDIDDLDLGNADIMSLNVGRFHHRHPHMNGGESREVDREKAILLRIEELTRGAHLVGAVVSFDADVLGQRMRAHGICPSWHYHLIDVEALAVGYLSATAAVCERRDAGEMPGPERGAELRQLTAAPWKSDDLSAALGVTVSDKDRHTALGDARWARAIYDAVIAR